jgi:hypothetical protein
MSEPRFDLWLEFEHWLPGEDAHPEEDFCNMRVTLADGRTFALNVWTFKYLPKAVEECRKTGENLHGAYLFAPDLFVERLDRALLERVVADLISCKGMRQEWQIASSDKVR